MYIYTVIEETKAPYGEIKQSIVAVYTSETREGFKFSEKHLADDTLIFELSHS